MDIPRLPSRTPLGPSDLPSAWPRDPVDGKGGGVIVVSCMTAVHTIIDSHPYSHPYQIGKEHVGFSPTRQKSRAPSAMRREVLGESHEA